MTTQWAELSPVAPFRFARLYGHEKYSLQGMLLREVGMPTKARPGAGKLLDVYQDRCYGEWREAAEATEVKHPSRLNGDAWFAGLTEEGLLFFAQHVADGLGMKMRVTGARVTRYTNVSSGYPCPLLTAVGAEVAPCST